MSLFSLMPPKQAYYVEVNGKVLDSEFEKLLDAERIALDYADKGLKVVIFDSLTGRQVGSFGN